MCKPFRGPFVTQTRIVPGFRLGPDLPANGEASQQNVLVFFLSFYRRTTRTLQRLRKRSNPTPSSGSQQNVLFLFVNPLYHTTRTTQAERVILVYRRTTRTWQRLRKPLHPTHGEASPLFFCFFVFLSILHNKQLTPHTLSALFFSTDGLLALGESCESLRTLRPALAHGRQVDRVQEGVVRWSI